ncbi:hypothetical protein [Alkaliphilus sp. B6464]|uniref:hypothetical protein n=1 Tax=Alkaliphilus sp. B6464 TaxID=2731219 RepID=UPI001BA52637|nr:hypothetical protein [Alkaliphilus sp. B6464]QUH22157.1 hypothetical protein HYG84_19815 [Alkaliphilus sp. B6464]
MNTLVANIENKLNILGQVRKLDIANRVLKNIEPERLSKIFELGNRDYHRSIQPHLLKSDKIFNVFNSENTELKDAYIYFINNDEENISLSNIDQYKDDFVLKLYKIKEELIDKAKENTYRYNDSYRISRGMKKSMMELLDYSLTNNVSIEELQNMYKTMYTLIYNYEYGSYQDMKNEDREMFCEFIKHSFVSLYGNNIIDLFKEIKGKTETIKLFNFIGEYNIVANDFNVEQPSDILEVLKSIEDRLHSDDFKRVMGIVFEREVLNKELKMLNYKIEKGQDYSSIYNYMDYIKFLYKDQYEDLFNEFNYILSRSSNKQNDFIIYCVRNRKKAFIKLMLEEKDTFNKLYDTCILFSNDFRNYININTLNKDNLIDISSVSSNEDVFKRISKGETITFNEYKILSGCSAFVIDIYFVLDMRIDDKLKLISELVGINEKNLKMPELSLEEKVQRVKSLLEQKPLSKWINDDLAHIKRCKRSRYLQILLNKDVFRRFIPEIKEENDIDFLMDNRNTPFMNMKDLKDAKHAYYKDSEELISLLNRMGLSDSFIEDNKDGICKFASEGLIRVVDTLYDCVNSAQKRNLMLLTKAYMAEQFEKVKFFNDDLDIEIGIQTTDKVKDEWKKNIKKDINNEYYCEETYDFKTTLKMGENPTSTCMNWRSGSYNNCLLSNFDTNKKLLVAGNSDGLVARAVIRLTKGIENLENYNYTQGKLTFKDIEKIEEYNNEMVIEQKEQLILFVERPYIKGVSDKIKKRILKTFVKIAMEKAKHINALVVVANSYYDSILDKQGLGCTSLEFKVYSVFISYSKNGMQYIDSFNGRTGPENEGHYVTDKLHIIEP